MQINNFAAGRAETSADPPTALKETIMTAVLYDDVLYVDVATRPPAPAPGPRRRRQSPIGAGGDPMVDAATRLLSIPLRQVYAVLWRVGVIEVLG